MDNSLSLVRVGITLCSLFLIIGLGMWFRKKRIIHPDSDGTFYWLLINLFTPCLILDSFLGHSEAFQSGSAFMAPLLGFSTILLGLFMATTGAWLLGVERGDPRKTFVICTSFANCGYMPIPFVMVFFNAHVLQTLFLFNVGLDIVFWSIGFAALTGKGSVLQGLKRVLNTPLLSIIFSLVVLFIYGKNPLPSGIMWMIHMTGQAAIPMSLLILGAIIFDHVPLLRFSGRLGTACSALGIRLLLLPILFITLAFWLPLPESLRVVMCLQAGMPAAMLPLVIISRCGGDIPLALRIIVGSTVGSFFTIPIWFSFSFA